MTLWLMTRWVHHGSNTCRRIKVTLTGCNGRVGRYVALLLKQSPVISELAVHDIANVGSDVGSLRHIDTPCELIVYQGYREQRTALQNADIVVLTAGVPRTRGLAKSDIFMINADIVAHLAEMCANVCPRALFAVLTNPLNSMVPIMSEVLRLNSSYNHNQVFGVASMYMIWASTVLAREMKKDPQNVTVPVIGGNSPYTIIPLLSQTKPSLSSLDDEKKMKELSSRIKSIGMDIVRAKGYNGTANLWAAYGTAKFVNALAKGLLGYPSVIEYAYVRSLVIPGCKYLVSPVELGIYGKKHVCHLPELHEYEVNQLQNALPLIKKDIYLGECYVQSKYKS